MKEIYTPYVRPDGIIVGIKGNKPVLSDFYVFEKDQIDYEMYEDAFTAFIQSGHPFEDQEWAFRELAPFIDHDTLLPPIELDVKEVEQYQSKFDGEWMDRLYQGENLPAPPDTVIRTILRIAKEEVKTYFPLHTRSERDFPEDFDQENGNYHNECCRCHKLFYGNKHRVVCKVCQPTEEATETQEGAALSWLQYIEGFPKIKELWESLSKSQPVMAKLFEININNFVDSQRKPK